MQATEFQENQNENFDIKEVFFKYLAFAHWIVLGAIMALMGAYFYLRYADETYEATNVIKILDNNNSGFKMPTDAMSFFSKGKVNLENEIEVLQSSLLIERVVDSLDLQNTYYVQGNIKETELGPTAPFRLHWADLREKVDAIEMSLSIELTPKGYYLEGSKDLKAFGTTYTYKKQPFYVLAKSLDPKKLVREYKIVKSDKEQAILKELNTLVA